MLMYKNGRERNRISLFSEDRDITESWFSRRSKGWLRFRTVKRRVEFAPDLRKRCINMKNGSHYPDFLYLNFTEIGRPMRATIFALPQTGAA